MIKSILNRRMFSILMLGISSGLPLLLIGGTLKAWMHDQKINLATIGLFALVGLPYSLKFLWAPLMDRFVPPFLDRRRGWMVIWQLCLISGLIMLANIQPAVHIWRLVWVCLLLACFSASQDIVIDAYKRDILKDEELGFGFAVGIAGYRIGMLAASGVALLLADRIGWRDTYLIMAATLMIGVAGACYAPSIENCQPPVNLKAAVLDPFLQFFSRSEAWMILLFILLYKVGDQIVSDMVNPFYLEMGFSKTQIGVVAKTFGLGSMIFGGLLGGLLLFRMGIVRSLYAFGIFQALSILSLTIFNYVGASLPWLAVAVSLENLASGMAGASYSAYMASLCDKRYSATQYALFSSLIGFTRVIFGSGSGFVAEHLGWNIFFIACALLAVPGLLLLIHLHRKNAILQPASNSHLV
ncbi:MAG: AmpG family muropeptide MFS transporter [Proteobacteria bacterium]|nr:AmpG family muropeptide MFS transporter [Pseudomonadota bacterium]